MRVCYQFLGHYAYCRSNEGSEDRQTTADTIMLSVNRDPLRDWACSSGVSQTTVRWIKCISQRSKSDLVLC